MVGEYLALLLKHPSINAAFTQFQHGSAVFEQIAAPNRDVKPHILQQLVQAIGEGKRLEVVYRSKSSPLGEERIIDPHALISSGIRWHARAWCEKHRQFRDFVLNRIEKVIAIYDKARPEASALHDTLWQEAVEIQLKPNPGLSSAQQDLIASDYGVLLPELLRIPCRKVLVPYLLNYLNVDLDEDKFEAGQRPLVLHNKEEIKPLLITESTTREYCPLVGTTTATVCQVDPN